MASAHLKNSSGLLTLTATTILLVSSFGYASSYPELSQCSFDKNLDAWICHSEENSQVLNDLDWVDKAFLPEEWAKQLAPGCTGAYIDPLQNQTTDIDDMRSLPLVVEANRSEVIDGLKATLEGDVKVSQGSRSISAEYMSYDRVNDEASLDGSVTIRQPGVLIRGDRADVSTTTQQGTFKDARFVMHDMHLRGSAGAISQDGPNKLTLLDGAITSCEPASNAWALEGAELSINRETGQGYGKSVKLSLGNVPVFYIPYMTFPVGDQRQSGFLFPSVSTSDVGGLDISVPYYLNLAPNYDATLTPRLITNRGAMLEGEFRHLSRYFLSGINASFLPNDEGGNRPEEESSQNSTTVGERWLGQFKQTGGLRTGWYSEIDYTQVSDENYFRDLGTSSFSVANTTYLDQSFEAGTSLRHWQLNARIEDYQTLLVDVDKPYRKLPQLNANGIYSFGSAKLKIDNQYSYFDHADEERLDGSPIVTGQRIATDYRAQWSVSKAGAYAKPEIGYKFLAYQLTPGRDDSVNNDTITLGAGQASLDVGLVFDNPGGDFLQTLEPRIFYLYRGYTNHDELYDATSSGESVNFDTSARSFSYGQLYRDSRFSGADRLDDANQVTVGLTHRWFSQKDGHEFFNISIGRINHFRDRRIGLESEISDTEKSSELAFEFGANWRNGSGLYGGLIYDEGTNETNRFSAGYNFASKDYLSLFNIGYSFVRANPEVSESEQLDQLDLGFVAPVSKSWYLMGRSNYDFENSQELESFFGFEYNDCCYRFRLLGRRWLDSNVANTEPSNDVGFDQGVFFEIHLKGLGGSGAKVNSIIEDAIPGYDRRENRLN